jgi:hypothetical protein
MGGFALGFAAPWMLSALLLLPAIYWLLRLTPPQPKRIWFAPLKLLQTRKHEDTPQSSPLWLILLRLALAACLIIAFAKPVWRAEPAVALNDAPLVLIIDNGWPSAPDWAQRVEHARDAIERASAHGLPILLAASNAGINQPFHFIDARAALSELSSLEPEPFLAKRMSLIKPLQENLAGRESTQLIWLSDGVESGDSAEFIAALKNLKPQPHITILTQATGNLRAITGAINSSQAMEAQIARLNKTSNGGTLRAFDRQSRLMASSPFSFGEDALTTQAKIALPSNLRNDVFRLDIADEGHVGAVYLLDERWQRKTAGLYSGSTQDYEQPLLSSLFILGEAMNGFAEVTKSGGSVSESLQTFIHDRVGAIVLADVGAIPQSVHQSLSEWLNDGGVLIRFSGTRLLESEAQSDPFLPVSLRPTLRALGGELSWEKEQKLGHAYGPLADITIPEDVSVSKQVLAEADPDLQKKTWMELRDGTPLITAQSRGRGYVILVHVSVDPNWSNLPLSGTFLDILRRLLLLSTLSSSQKPADAAPQNTLSILLKPQRSLNAHGALLSPPANAKALAAAEFSKARPDAEHPPGLYGSDSLFHTLNAMHSDDKLIPIDFAAQSLNPFHLEKKLDEALQPFFLTIAFLLFLADCVLSFLLLGGGLRTRFARATSVVFVMTIMAGMIGSVYAQTAVNPAAHARQPSANNEDALVPAANATRLAYVKTGISDVDSIAMAGLKGLSAALRERTAIEPSDPTGIDIASDELTFYPMLYWPIDPKMQKPSAEALAKAEAYMRNGGTIIFDTRDRGETWMGGVENATPGEVFLRSMLSSMNLPQLESVPSDHVLTKSFYILNSFPGRFEDGPLWVERTVPNSEPDKRPVRLADGVSSIIITSNDLAGAWAIDDLGSPMLPLYGSDPRQREMSLRAGINIVVYLLTGNYKADQVHVPDILQRLGQ